MFIQRGQSIAREKSWSHICFVMMASVLLFGVAMIGCKEKARGINGDWMGVLKVGGKTDHGALHIRTDAEGHLVVTIDSLDDKVMGLPCSNILLRENDFSFDVPVIHGNYKGILSPDGRMIKGVWTKDGSHPIDFVRQPDPPDGDQEP